MNFRFLNIPVRILPTFWIFLLIFCCDPQLSLWRMCLLAVVLLFSLLFHEYGHALAARKLGRAPEITIENFGGYASYDGRGLSEWQHFVITLCGPLFTAVLIATSYYLLKNQVFSSIPIQYFLYYMKYLNTYWLIVNLAPLNPLDGGKIAGYLLNRCLGENNGSRFSWFLGNITALVGASYFLVEGSYLFAYLFLYNGWKNLQVAPARKQQTNDFGQYNEALSALENNEMEKAQILLEKLSKSKNEYVKIHSIELLAEILEKKGEVQQAYDLLSKVGVENLNRGKWLLCKLAFMQGNDRLIEKLSMEIYTIHPTFETAILNAKAFSRLQNPDHSLGWLKTAFQFPALDQDRIDDLLADPVFIPLHNEPEFLQLNQSQRELICR